MSKLFVVGIGPGDLNHMTYEARAAIGAGTLSPWASSVDSGMPPVRRATVAAAMAAGSFVAAKAMPSVSIRQSFACSRAARGMAARSSS